MVYQVVFNKEDLSYCSQCSISTLGYDSKYLADLVDDPLDFAQVKCVVCGFTVVDINGVCVSAECSQHGKA